MTQKDDGGQEDMKVVTSLLSPHAHEVLSAIGKASGNITPAADYIFTLEQQAIADHRDAQQLREQVENQSVLIAHEVRAYEEAARRRDAAEERVRVLEEALRKYGYRLCMASLQAGVSKSWKEALRLPESLKQLIPEPQVAYLGADKWECEHEHCAEIRALLLPSPVQPGSTEAG